MERTCRQTRLPPTHGESLLSLNQHKALAVRGIEKSPLNDDDSSKIKKGVKWQARKQAV